MFEAEVKSQPCVNTRHPRLFAALNYLPQHKSYSLPQISRNRPKSPKFWTTKSVKMKDDDHANGVRESVGIGSGTSTGVDEAGATFAPEDSAPRQEDRDNSTVRTTSRVKGVIWLAILI